MRSIRERLQAMDTATPERAATSRATSETIDSVAPGVERWNGRGSYYLVEEFLPDPTGGEFQSHPSPLPRSISSTWVPHASIGPSDILFLDTETTGLDRGTGTHVFLVGAGYFDDGGFRVRQYFIRDLYEEASLLHDLDKLIQSFSVMVTFNGRTFDWPLLYNRFILHGHRQFPDFYHWDLLPWSRRVWRQRLRDCSLGNLERCVLGITRYGDVPGYLIPQRYFDYLRTRDARPLKPVFRHNQQDIVSLARLADVLLSAERDPAGTLDHPVDRIAYGLQLLNQGLTIQAEAMIREVFDLPLIDPELRHRAARGLATCCKRSGRWADAIGIWREMRRFPWSTPDEALYPLIELAKAYEHRLRDGAAALSEVERAMNLVSLHGWTEHQHALTHRYARLVRRQSRNGDRVVGGPDE